MCERAYLMSIQPYQPPTTPTLLWHILDKPSEDINYSFINNSSNCYLSREYYWGLMIGILHQNVLMKTCRDFLLLCSKNITISVLPRCPHYAILNFSKSYLADLDGWQLELWADVIFKGYFYMWFSMDIQIAQIAWEI